jgi:quercetin dioxygenase-like cupin family protein
MKIQKIKNSFKDKRGVIKDVLVNMPMDTITYIESKAGAVRGNHYHKKSIQYDYIIDGEMISVSRDGFNGKTTRKKVSAGDLVLHPKNNHHAYKAIKDSKFISVTKGPRRGKDYEKDVFRLDIPLI